MQTLSLDPSTLLRPTSPAGTPSSSSANAAGRTGAATAMPSAEFTAAPRPSPAAKASPALRTSALQAWVPGQQQQVAATQQTADYLGRLGQALGEFKQGLSQAIALKLPASSTLLAQRDQIGQLWQQRSSATAGTLDAQGQRTEPGAARQNFQMRGLDQASLTSPARETLSLNVPGQRQAITVVLGNASGQPADPDSALRQLNEALAPADLKATLNSEDGSVQLSVPEAQWPAVRDGLSLRGGGQRFPAGQPTRPRLEAQPEAMQPARWQLGDATSQRETLHAVLGAERLVRERSHETRSELAELQAAADTSSAESLAAAQDRAQATADKLAAAPAYASWRELLPAVHALQRDRVDKLLS
ncbi:hypothetical protein LRH25_01905 [Ideonella azotifigens]|uniref:Flagellin n=2 Tax=Ideonella azotifigens TaxID=513160 RepID=A0ABP3VLB3_9BURK|nr:hypothetical protein [Ideonella azotifigens]MCD2339088.1 hypothetical protein [Ideonella azotifigens]